MGFFDDSLSVISGTKPHRRHSSRSHHKKKRSRSRSRSSSRGRGKGSGLGSIFGGDNYKHNSSSKASFFNLGDDRNGSRSSFFNFGGKPSYYKRSSRQGFLQRSYKQLKRLLRDLVHWAKRHPWKVFFLVLMPLISGGILTALLARFGLRLPGSLERLMGVASKAVTGDTAGLVGEAVRMASGGGAAAAPASVRVNASGYDDGMAWERSYRSEGETNWGDAVTKGISKMFF
ncbi:unnamed protein product [Clonostachys solani]|uniref:Uncharacterized protein n=1 Tax=Clonostachys solani TaxID=160281 RepID=A0A9N9Z5T9_9HYPO|nr:unnamed protein product [Clonostachys solani]